MPYLKKSGIEAPWHTGACFAGSIPATTNGYLTRGDQQWLFTSNGTGCIACCTAIHGAMYAEGDMNVHRQYGKGGSIEFSENELYGMYNTLLWLADCAQDEEDKTNIMDVAAQLYHEINHGNYTLQ